MKVMLKPVKCFLLQREGQPDVLLTEHSRWNGMLELQDAKGAKIIVESPGAMAEILSTSFFGDAIEVDVVKIAPSLVAYGNVENT